MVGREAAQAVLDRLHHPFARQAAAVGALADRVGELGRNHPLVALGRDHPTDDLLGPAAIVGVGRVNEVDAGVARLADDPGRIGFVSGAAEVHDAEAER